MYDPEAIYQDADIETIELRNEARQVKQMIKDGNCPHPHTGPRNWPNDKECICYECSHVFGTTNDRDRELGFDN